MRCLLLLALLCGCDRVGAVAKHVRAVCAEGGYKADPDLPSYPCGATAGQIRQYLVDNGATSDALEALRNADTVLQVEKAWDGLESDQALRRE
jgi:hypothetical protein